MPLSEKHRKRIEGSLFKSAGDGKSVFEMAKRVHDRADQIVQKFQFATKEVRDLCKRLANTLCFRAELMGIKIKFNAYKRLYNRLRSAKNVEERNARSQAIFESVLRV